MKGVDTKFRFQMGQAPAQQRWDGSSVWKQGNEKLKLKPSCKDAQLFLGSLGTAPAGFLICSSGIS